MGTYSNREWDDSMRAADLDRIQRLAGALMSASENLSEFIGLCAEAELITHKEHMKVTDLYHDLAAFLDKVDTVAWAEMSKLAMEKMNAAD